MQILQYRTGGLTKWFYKSENAGPKCRKHLPPPSSKHQMGEYLFKDLKFLCYQALKLEWMMSILYHGPKLNQDEV